MQRNSKLLVLKEQGIGDEILYGSMYPDLIKKFPKVKIETEQRLIPLFKRSLDVENVFVPYEKYSQNEKKLKKFDKILYAGSLGRLFRNKLSDFPKKSRKFQLLILEYVPFIEICQIYVLILFI